LVQGANQYSTYSFHHTNLDETGPFLLLVGRVVCYRYIKPVSLIILHKIIFCHTGPPLFFILTSIPPPFLPPPHIRGKRRGGKKLRLGSPASFFVKKSFFFVKKKINNAGVGPPPYYYYKIYNFLRTLPVLYFFYMPPFSPHI
jgi:hypothetical protein